jgi:transposase
MEQLEYNLLFRWFVGLSMDDAVWGCRSFLQEPASPAGRRYCLQVHDLFSILLGHGSATVGAHFSRLSEI